MYVRDLDVCSYGSLSPFSAKSWSVPLRGVGWLEGGHPFEVGAAPRWLVPRLMSVGAEMRRAYPGFVYRGLHGCSLCPPRQLEFRLRDSIRHSDTNLLIPGTKTVYIAPAGMHHYVERHDYLPPSEFLDALEACPDCRTIEYLDALCVANDGAPIPFELYEWLLDPSASQGRE